MIRLGLMLAMFVLGGCAAFKAYESPQSGPRTHVTISKISNLTGEPEGVDSPKMHVGVIETDADGSVHSKGGVDLERIERAKTFVMPAGRAQVVISMNRLHGHSTSEYVSFLLENGREYELRYNLLRNDEPPKIRYGFTYNRFDGPDRKPIPVDVDHWSTCEREKKAMKDNSK